MNMIKRINLIFSIVFIGIFILITGFTTIKKRKFDITFKLNEITSFVPSNQIAIWLETTDSSFVKTLFLTEYLSYGGYNLPEICYDWSTKTNWEETTKEEFDAVTSATPRVGEVRLKLECPGNLIPDGKYNIFIEVHLTEDYNELYSGGLIISGKKFHNTLQVTYRPEKYIEKSEGDILSDVQIRCK
jgi:hypothetical protein